MKTLILSWGRCGVAYRPSGIKVVTWAAPLPVGGFVYKEECWEPPTRHSTTTEGDTPLPTLLQVRYGHTPTCTMATLNEALTALT